MKTRWISTGLFLCGLLLVAGMFNPPSLLSAEEEQKFDVLEVGARMYTNVTVTTKAKDYVFMLHSGGMLNLKVSELDPELLEKLGYEVKKAGTNTWTKQALAAVERPEVKEVEKQMSEALSRYAGPSAPQIELNPMTLASALVILLSAYIFLCGCFHLICKKAGNPGGVLVWIPLFQLIPLLRAAGMSGWWFVAFFVPLLNIVAQVLWSLRIAEARGKNIVWGIFLILPVTNIIALLYLAFSGVSSEKDKKKDRKGPIQLMRLETA